MTAYHVILTLHEMFGSCSLSVSFTGRVMFTYACSIPSLAVNFRKVSLKFAAPEFASHKANPQCSVVDVQILYITFVCKISVVKHSLTLLHCIYDSFNDVFNPCRII